MRKRPLAATHTIPGVGHDTKGLFDRVGVESLKLMHEAFAKRRYLLLAKRRIPFPRAGREVAISAKNTREAASHSQQPELRIVGGCDGDFFLSLV